MWKQQNQRGFAKHTENTPSVSIADSSPEVGAYKPPPLGEVSRNETEKVCKRTERHQVIYCLNYKS